MKAIFFTAALIACTLSHAQDVDSSYHYSSSFDDEETTDSETYRHYRSRHEIRTLFNNPRASGGYGAIVNQFSSVRGEYANLVGIYGGWYIDHWFLIGVGASATTNNISVPEQFSTLPGVEMSYQYGQVGLMTEYIISSNRAVHIAFNVLAGAGFTLQYDRHQYEENNDWEQRTDYDHNTRWFPVVEPGVQVELNVFRWLRFSPGVSYRFTHGADGKGIGDDQLKSMNVNLTLKIGKF